MIAISGKPSPVHGKGAVGCAHPAYEIAMAAEPLPERQPQSRGDGFPEMACLDCDEPARWPSDYCGACLEARFGEDA